MTWQLACQIVAVAVFGVVLCSAFYAWQDRRARKKRQEQDAQRHALKLDKNSVAVLRAVSDQKGKGHTGSITNQVRRDLRLPAFMPGTVSQILDDCEARGLLTQRQEMVERRNFPIDFFTITPDGQRFLDVIEIRYGSGQTDTIQVATDAIAHFLTTSKMRCAVIHANGSVSYIDYDIEARLKKLGGNPRVEPREHPLSTSHENPRPSGDPPSSRPRNTQR